KSGNRQLMAEIGQHLRDVQALARGVAEHGFTAIDLAQLQRTELHGQVQRRVHGQGKNFRHYKASTSARTSLALPKVSAVCASCCAVLRFSSRTQALTSPMLRAETLNSSTPSPTSTGTANGSAASSPQIPTHLPWAWAARTVMSISCSTAGCRPSA